MRFVDITIIASVIVIALLTITLAYFGFISAEPSTIIVPLSAVATACFAYMGLSTWKERMRYDIATRLLALIHEYRDAMHELVNPIINLIITTDDTFHEKNTKISNMERDFDATRYDAMVTVRKKIHTDISIMNTSWDEKLREIFEKMHQIENGIKESSKEIRANLGTIKVTDCDDFSGAKALQNFNLMRKKYKAHTKKLDELVEEVENYLKPKTRL